MAQMQPSGDELIHLVGQHVSLVLERDGTNAPLWRYWGPRLPEHGSVPPLRPMRSAASFSLDQDVPLSLFPTFGVGWFGPSALLAHRDGTHFAQSWTHCAISWVTPHRHVVITLRDDVAQVAVSVSLSLDPVSDVVSIQTCLTNTGASPLWVQHLAAAYLPLPNTPLTLRHYVGRHNREFQVQQQRLQPGGWHSENRRGLTGHAGPCGAIVMNAEGGAWGAQLAWSGNSAQSIDWIDAGAYVWQLGEWHAPGEVRLAPGDCLTAPAVLATYSPNGADGVAGNFHAAIRARMDWPNGKMAPRPVHLNTWEGFYFDHDIAELTELATAAADVGIERFVLDDGWFYRRDDDTRGLGDWWPDITKYPEGLGPLAAHVTKRGMEFGLWVEPEMVNPDSDLFRSHPDWALQIADRPLLTARHQLVLDLTRAEVTEYLFGCLDRLLSSLPIGYLKWDHNRDLTTAGGVSGTAAYRDQIRAAYALIDRIRAAHPQVEIEACAGGGGRIDAGIIQRTHRFWTSDNIDAVSRLPIQHGFLQFMPPELIGAHIGAAPAHATGRSQSIDFRAAVALPGHFGVELDVRKLTPNDRDRLAHWIGLYKKLRDQLHGGATYRGEAGDGVSWQAHGDTDEWLLFVCRVSPTALRQPPAIRLHFADSSADYAVTQIEPATADAVHFGGAWLQQAGLPIGAMSAESAKIFRLTRQ
jgi:alpha-galactosidase